MRYWCGKSLTKLKFPGLLVAISHIEVLSLKLIIITVVRSLMGDK